MLAASAAHRRQFRDRLAPVGDDEGPALAHLPQISPEARFQLARTDVGPAGHVVIMTTCYLTGQPWRVEAVVLPCAPHDPRPPSLRPALLLRRPRGASRERAVP